MVVVGLLVLLNVSGVMERKLVIVGVDLLRLLLLFKKCFC